jgi:outer membrane protein assembly factor BamB
MRRNIYKILVVAIFMVGMAGHPAKAQSGDCWGNFRGNNRLNGVSLATIPAKPEMLWNFNTQGSIMAAPVACKGIIVVGTTRGALYGINADGTLRWKIMAENSIESPALILNDRVYAGDLDGMVYALDLNTGAILWTYQTDNQVMGSPAYHRKGNKDVILVGSYDYYLHGIDPGSGKGLWKYETDNFINGACALYDGMAVFGGCDGYLHLVEALSGKSKASLEISTYVASSAGIDGDFAYVGDYDGRFSAIDLKKQEVTWVFSNKEANLPFIASPAIIGDHVYIGNRDKFLYCLNKRDGKVVWKYNTGSRVDASPVVIGDKLLVANMRGDIFLMDRRSGKPLWTYELGTPVNANPAVVDNRIYVAGDDGRVYCFGKK